MLTATINTALSLHISKRRKGKKKRKIIENRDFFLRQYLNIELSIYRCLEFGTKGWRSVKCPVLTPTPWDWRERSVLFGTV